MSAPDEASHYQSLALNREAAKNVYMVPIMPRNMDSNMTHAEADVTEKLPSDEREEKRDQEQPSGNSSQRNWLCTAMVVIVFTITIVTILAASLSFASYNNMQLAKATTESQEELKTKDDMIRNLYQQIQNLTESLQRMEVRMEQQNEATRVEVDAISALLNSTIDSNADSISSLSSTLEQTRQDAQEAHGDISRHDSQISTITSNVANLFSSQLDLSRDCSREVSTCTVLKPYSLYDPNYYAKYSSCSTGPVALNKDVSVRMCLSVIHTCSVIHIIYWLNLF